MPQEPKPFVIQLHEVMSRNMRRAPLLPEEEGVFFPPDSEQAKVLENMSYFMNFKMHPEKPVRAPDDPTNTSYPDKGKIMVSAQLGRDLAKLVFAPEESVAGEFLERQDVYDKLKLNIGALVTGLVPETEFKEDPGLYTKVLRAAAVHRQENNAPENTFWKAKVNHTVSVTGEAPATTSAAERVPALTPGRPTLIYFGGMLAMSEQKGYIDRVMTRLERFVSPKEYSLKDFDIVTATYANGAATHKTANIYAYQENPKEFYSEQARYFVNNGLMPLISEPGEGGVPKRFKDPQQLYHNLSMLSIIGYSYGTAYIQEFRNALREKLLVLGYSPEESETAVHKVAALNLGSVAKVVDKSAEGGDFMQVHATGDNDKRSHVRTDVRSQVEADPSPILKQAKIGSNLILYGMGIENVMRGFLLEDSGFDQPGFARMLTVKDQTRDDPTGHGIEGYLRITRRRPDDGLNTLQKNPGTRFIREFIERAITGSIHQAQGLGERDLGAIVETLSEKYLTPAAIIESGERMREEKLLYKHMSDMAPENANRRLRQRLEEKGIDPEQIDRIAPLPGTNPNLPDK